MPNPRGVLRHPRFDELVTAVDEKFPRAQAVIDGAIWEIQRNPSGSGVRLTEYDIWMARIESPPPPVPAMLVFYSFNNRFVFMLTVLPADGSAAF